MICQPSGSYQPYFQAKAEYQASWSRVDDQVDETSIIRQDVNHIIKAI